MIRPCITILTLACLVAANVLTQGVELVGRLYHVDERGQKVWLRGVGIQLVQLERRTVTNDTGVFRLSLDPIGLQPGRDLTVETVSDKWVIRNSQWRMPQQLLDPIEFEVVPKGDRSLLAPHELRRLLEEASRAPDRAVANPAAAVPVARGRDGYRETVREFALSRGFTLEQVQNSIDEWAREVRLTSRDRNDLGLALLAQQQFAQAALEFGAAAETHEQRQRQLAERRLDLEREVIEERRAAVDARLAEGNSYRLATSYDKAFAAYGAALTSADRRSQPAAWAQIQTRLGQLEMEASSHTDRGARLQRAEQHFRSALEIYTREGSPKEWAEAQTGFGLALLSQQRTAEGTTRRTMLEAASAALKSVLQVRTREADPHTWAETQLIIANALVAGAEDGRPDLFDEAIASYRRVLEVMTRTAFPEEWAQTQHEIGWTLTAQAAQTPDPDGLRLLRDARVAYGDAVQVYTRASTPEVWATIQGNLGMAITAQAIRAHDNDAHQLFVEAVATFRGALGVLTRSTAAYMWAMQQNNLGFALFSQAGRSNGKQREQLLTESAAAYRAALELITPDATRRWKQIQDNLAGTLFELSKSADAGRRAELLFEIADIYRSILKVLSFDDARGDWIRLQDNFARVLVALVGSATGTDRDAMAREAVDAFRRLLARVPSDREALLAATSLLRDTLFDYSTERALLETWLSTGQDDPAMRVALAESTLRGADWRPASERSMQIRDDPNLSPHVRIAFGIYAVLSLMAQEVPAATELDRLVAIAQREVRQGDAGGWNTAAVRRAAASMKALDPTNPTVAELLSIVDSWTADDLVSRLRAVRARIRDARTP